LKKVQSISFILALTNLQDKAAEPGNLVSSFPGDNSVENLTVIIKFNSIDQLIN